VLALDGSSMEVPYFLLHRSHDNFHLHGIVEVPWKFQPSMELWDSIEA
jgi:hypothetical protein